MAFWIYFLGTIGTGILIGIGTGKGSLATAGVLALVVMMAFLHDSFESLVRELKRKD